MCVCKFAIIGISQARGECRGQFIKNISHAGRALCAAAGARERHSESAEAGDGMQGDEDTIIIASSDSEEQGIALGNAPGARGASHVVSPTFPTVYPCLDVFLQCC